jgi:hypothetical protein
VVRNASAKNLSVARLRARIRTLGEVAVAIARKIPGLDRLLG